MNKFTRWIGPSCALILCSVCGYTQENKVARLAPIALSKELPAVAGSVVSGATKNALGQKLSASLAQHMAVYQQEKILAEGALMKMESAYLLTKYADLRQKFQANAFLIETTYEGKKEVWGVTASELLNGFGEEVVLHTTVGKQDVSIPAEVAVHGPKALSNIALLRLKGPIPEGLKPLKLSNYYDFDEPVSIFGYNKGQLSAVQNLQLQKDNGLFMRINLNDIDWKQTGPFGGPVFSQGKLIGVYCNRSFSGGYASTIRTLPFLVEAAHTGTTNFPLQMHGVLFGHIKPTEVILTIEAIDVRGKIIKRIYAKNELHQSEIFKLYHNEETRYMRFLLEDRVNGRYETSAANEFRYLIYDKHHDFHWFHPIPRTR